MSTIDPDQFWNYSISLYATPGVEEACLKLQDEHGLSVNILLLACWAGDIGVKLSHTELETIMAETSRWTKEVIEPLRLARRNLKPLEGGDTDRIELRSGIKHHELAAEKIQQAILVAALKGKTPGSPNSTFAIDNLKTYTSISGCKPASHPYIETILTAAFEHGNGSKVH